MGSVIRDSASPKAGRSPLARAVHGQAFPPRLFREGHAASMAHPRTAPRARRSRRRNIRWEGSSQVNPAPLRFPRCCGVNAVLLRGPCADAPQASLAAGIALGAFATPVYPLSTPSDPTTGEAYDHCLRHPRPGLPRAATSPQESSAPCPAPPRLRRPAPPATTARTPPSVAGFASGLCRPPAIASRSPGPCGTFPESHRCGL